MVRLHSTFRASALYGLLAASCGEAVAPTPRPLRQRAPDVNPTVAEPNPATITAVSECHLHGTVQFVIHLRPLPFARLTRSRYCQAGTTEFKISGSVTADSYTDCHGHGTDT